MRLFNEHIIARAIAAGRVTTDRQHIAFCERESQINADTRIAALLSGRCNPFHSKGRPTPRPVHDFFNPSKSCGACGAGPHEAHRPILAMG